MHAKHPEIAKKWDMEGKDYVAGGKPKGKTKKRGK